MKLLRCITLALAIMTLSPVAAIDSENIALKADSAANDDRTRRFYDSLESKSTRRDIPRFIYKSLVVRSKKDTLTNVKVVDESKQYYLHDKREISTITIEQVGVFDTTYNSLERFVNKMHRVTRERTIRRDLLFKEGDRFDPEVVVNNVQLLKERSYIYDAKITARPSAEDSTKVDVVVRTQDNWTLSADARLNVSGRSMVEIYDANLLGFGNKLSIATNFDWKKGHYGGNKVRYNMPNIMGTFFRGELIAGKNFDNTDLGLDIRREFILPTDYELGANYLDSELPYYMLYADSSFQVKSRNLGLWGGKSFYVPGLRSSIYLMGSYSKLQYDMRPDVTPTFNPYFHNGRLMLVSLGLYREKFYTTNLIYGYGVKEYIPSGFRAELVGGHRWGEFSNDYYLGGTYSVGGFSSIGHLMGKLSLGSYYDTRTRSFKQGTISADMRYFSNLLNSGRSLIRQFVTLNYISGWNRDEGCNEVVAFNDKQLRGFDDYAIGLNRAMLSSETVVFTPLQPLGFRLTFFGFADLGSLGDSPNIFKNVFYSTFGLGVRIKNERLVFSTIQIRLGIAVGKAGILRNEVFNLSNHYNMERYRYLPQRPDQVIYR